MGLGKVAGVRKTDHFGKVGGLVKVGGFGKVGVLGNVGLEDSQYMKYGCAFPEHAVRAGIVMDDFHLSCVLPKKKRPINNLADRPIGR